MSAKLVKKLRDISGQGIMDCKNMINTATEILGGSASEDEILAKAMDELQKISHKKVEKRAARYAQEGSVIAISKDDYAFILEVNCETDFVARNDSFKEFTEALCKVALDNQPSNLTELLSLQFSDSESVEAACQTMITKTGENIKISQFFGMKSSGANLLTYEHGTKLAVLVEYQGAESAAKDIAMHVAANNPVSIDSNGVCAKLLAKERELFEVQAKESGKPENVQEKMIEGKLAKFFAEVTLLQQAFVKDDTISVSDYLAKNSTTVKSFKRVALGEVGSSEA
jgi:elongation factor Ts